MYDCRTPLVAPCTDLVHQVRDVLLPCFPALMQIVFVGVQLTGSLGTNDFWKGRSGQIASDRLTVSSQQTGNCSLARALLVQLEHFFIARLASGSSGVSLHLLERKWGGLRRCCAGWNCRNRHTRLLQAVLLSCDQLEYIMFAFKQADQSRIQVHQYMKAVADLGGLRGASPGSISIRPRTITRDDLDFRMLFEPADERFRLAIGQQVNDLMLLYIFFLVLVKMLHFPFNRAYRVYCYASVLNSRRSCDRSREDTCHFVTFQVHVPLVSRRSGSAP